VSETQIKVLLAEDERNLSRILETQLRKRGFDVAVAADGRAAIDALKAEEFDVALVDLVMPEVDGIGVLREAMGLDAHPEVVIVTGNGTVETAIAAMKLGAYDYLTKPCRVAELDMVVRRAFEKKKLAQENIRLQTRLSRREEFPDIVTASPNMEEILELARKVAASDSAVLISGESGTGKELVARAVHRLSPRSEGPLTDINCAAIQENLLESELFGHERGAFTGAMTRKLGLFELADSGTLFMDEIAELAPRLQSKLLRALEAGEFFRVGGTQKVSTDIRLLAATNRNIDHEVAEGNFREDLYYRINTLTITIPPLSATSWSGSPSSGRVRRFGPRTCREILPGVRNPMARAPVSWANPYRWKTWSGRISRPSCSGRIGTKAAPRTPWGFRPRRYIGKYALMGWSDRADGNY
jgi:DNA-binding NtrC family response regulator